MRNHSLRCSGFDNDHSHCSSHNLGHIRAVLATVHRLTRRVDRGCEIHSIRGLMHELASLNCSSGLILESSDISESKVEVHEEAKAD